LYLRLLVLAENESLEPAWVAAPLYSRSKTRTSESPAQVTTVRSLEWGMNLTEKMFAWCPVLTLVFSEKVRAVPDGL
jgi:hypothetical protein